MIKLNSINVSEDEVLIVDESGKERLYKRKYESQSDCPHNHVIPYRYEPMYIPLKLNSEEQLCKTQSMRLTRVKCWDCGAIIDIDKDMPKE